MNETIEVMGGGEMESVVGYERTAPIYRG